MRIGIDVDGVLADFNPAYIRLLKQLTGKDADEAYQPQTWNYEAALGFTPEEVKRAWEWIVGSSAFWRNLDTLAGCQDYWDVFEHFDGSGCSEAEEVYFITARPGRAVKEQTEGWFYNHGVERATVLISKEKGLCAKALDLEVYIDDKGENILDVQEKSPSTRAYLLNQPYNRDFTVIRRSDSVGAILAAEGYLAAR